MEMILQAAVPEGVNLRILLRPKSMTSQYEKLMVKAGVRWVFQNNRPHQAKRKTFTTTERLQEIL